jgi:hypothetical protein
MEPKKNAIEGAKKAVGSKSRSKTRPWISGGECNICSKTTKHTHFK